jgi:3-deoxy-7-phosphoheptulonate synthase
MHRDPEAARPTGGFFVAAGVVIAKETAPMSRSTDDVRILEIKELSTPAAVIEEIPRTEPVTDTVAAVRRSVHDILIGADDRLAVVVGPCSIHDPAAALEYAGRLGGVRARLGGELEIIMRVYFEKPRTTVGWKGLINDPDLDGSFQINKGLRLARRLLVDINRLGLPAGCEFLDTAIPQYIADLVGWAAIGARTTESQIHREMASGLSSPVGFKNGTDGDVRIAIDAVLSAARPHHFMAVTKEGQAAIAATKGNEDCHIVLRGGRAPNYDARSVDAACTELARSGLNPVVMIDASHANSGKKPENQPGVVADIAGRLEAGDRRIIGVMVESHLVGGRQDLTPGRPLRYGQSITDGCLDWQATVAVLERLAIAVERRRADAGRHQLASAAMPA